jgi:hypothetical protein
MKKILSFIVLIFLFGSCKKQEIQFDSLTETVNPDSSITYKIASGDPSLTYQWEVNGIPVGSNSKTLTCLPTRDDLVTCATAAAGTVVSDAFKFAAPVSLLVNGDGTGTTDWDDKDHTDNGLADNWYSRHQMRWTIVSVHGDKVQKVTGFSTHGYLHISDRPDAGENKFKLKNGETYSLSFIYTCAPDSIRVAYTELIFPPKDRPTRASCQFTYHGPDNVNILFYSINQKPGNCNDWFTLDKMNLSRIQ